MWPAIRGNSEVMELLPDKWAYVNGVEDECWTTLDAVIRGGKDVVSLLLGGGCNADAKTAGAKATLKLAHSIDQRRSRISSDLGAKE